MKRLTMSGIADQPKEGKAIWFVLPALMCLFLFLLALDRAHLSVDKVSSFTGGVSGRRYLPPVSARWQLQLQGDVNTRYPVELYDIDLFDSSKILIDGLHASGKRVICYFSAGSSEDWRSDDPEFHADDKGSSLQGWQGERWLNIRSENVREIMKTRMDYALRQGCDGVDPDNVDAYTNPSGFYFTAEDQLDYNRFLAVEAHKRNLAIGLKNDLDQISDLVDYFDFSVDEQCFEYDECEKLRPFTDRNKAVLNVEYKSPYANMPEMRQALCDQAKSMKFSTLVLPIKLDDDFRYSCLQ
jgi:hypothetical protein